MRYLDEIRDRGTKANPFFRLMGIEIVSYGGGKSELSMKLRPDMMNGAGWMQGGLFTALCDEAMALALFTVMDERESIATISESTSYFWGVREGEIVANGSVIRKARQVAFTEGQVRVAGDGGKLLSKTSASFSIIKKS
jgi:acyl-CoA thioesterase